MCPIFHDWAAMNICSAESVFLRGHIVFFDKQGENTNRADTQSKGYHFRPIYVKLLNELQFKKSFKPHPTFF